MSKFELVGLAAGARCGKDTAAIHLTSKHGYIQYSFAQPIKDFFEKLFDWGEEYREGDLKEVEQLAVAVPDQLLTEALEEFFGGLMEVDELYELWFSVFNEYVTLRQFEGDDSEPTEVYLDANGEPCSDYRISPRKAYQLLGTEFGRGIDPNIWIKLAQTEFEQLRETYTDDTFHKGMVIADVRFENEATWIRQNCGQIIHIARPGAGIEESAHSSEAGIMKQVADKTVVNDSSIEDFYKKLEEVICLPE